MIKQILILLFSFALFLTPLYSSDNKKFDYNLKSCRYLVNIDKYLDSIKNEVQIWTKDENSCKNDLVDSLTDRYITTREDKYFYCLVAVCNVADKSLYKSLLEANGMMFYAIFDDYIKKLCYFNKIYKEEHCFVKYLIEALSLEVFTSKNPSQELKEIDKFISTESDKHHLTQEQKLFLSEIQKKIDPTIWEKE